MKNNALILLTKRLRGLAHRGAATLGQTTKTLSLVLMLALLCPLWTSCDDGEGPKSPNNTAVEISWLMPTDRECGTETEITLTLASVSDGTQKEIALTQNGEIVTVVDDLYNVTLSIKTSVNGQVLNFRATAQNQALSGGAAALTFEPQLIRVGNGLTIAEVALTSRLPEGMTSYNGSAWFRLYNATEDTVYADSLCLFESSFKTTLCYEYTPDIMSEAVAINTIYMIPGSGKEHAVAPGHFLLIADVAKDHRDANPLSYDLSGADFEWYDENEKTPDTDIAEVPNLITIAKASSTIWSPNVQGITAFGIGRLPEGVTPESFVSDNAYAPTYELVTTNSTTGETVSKTMTVKNTYSFPNAWVDDIVTFSPSTKYAWNVTDASLDGGYVSIGETGSDKNRFGRSARRKVENGIMMDTNNSTNDFEVADADPQHLFF